jgi:uncharacterized protein (DUF1015 family)
MVPDFSPFPGLRYRLEPPGASLGDLTAPPYDVIDAEAQARLEAAHPHNAIRLILPRDAGAEVGDRYQQAADTFRRWQAEGVLLADEPRFYVYRIAHDGRTMLGVVGALELSAAGEGSVLPHERTMPKPKGDRLSLIQAVRANLDPVWCLSLAPGLTDLLGPLGTPAASCADGEGAVHCLFPVDDPALAEAIAARVASAPVVIADGHHRYETAIAYRDELRATQGRAGAAERIMALVVELSPEQLCVAPIHRLLAGTGGDLRARLSAAARVVDAGANTPEGVAALLDRMANEGALSLVDADGLWLVTPDESALAVGLAALPACLRDIDAARLDVLLAMVGPPASLEYPHDPVGAAAAVAKGAADAAVLLRPVTVDQIAAVADAEERMPEKTSFFQPKPLTGLVFRSLDL